MEKERWRETTDMEPERKRDTERGRRGAGVRHGEMQRGEDRDGERDRHTEKVLARSVTAAF